MPRGFASVPRREPGPGPGADARRHQRGVRAVLQLVVRPRGPRVPLHAALQPGHRGHRGQGQPGGHLPLAAGTQAALLDTSAI